ncbi:MAG: hypothetical protein A2041_01835 [Bacteroidetes bacterium GWA2_31_9b]|nr:MAG: hypothetical protein A2041_01835 [Bacteroidetes bacterium GWA2_31_9b]
MLSNTCKYAIRSVIFLSINNSENKKIGIKEISKELNIPSPFLGKILQILAKHKLLNSTKGPNGGFSLAKPANEISLLNIIEIIDGLDLFTNCIIGLRTCKQTGNIDLHCPIHSRYKPIGIQLYELFNSESIENLKNEILDSNGKIGL